MIPNRLYGNIYVVKVLFTVPRWHYLVVIKRRSNIMNRQLIYVPLAITVIACVSLVVHGPIAQLPNYHDFADQSAWLGIANAADVLSNIGFAVIGVCGYIVLRPMQTHPALSRGWIGYRLFLAGLVLTALGSSFYHLAPDNARLVWDRLPIVLACAGLLSAVRAETRQDTNVIRDTTLLALFAIASVAWWWFTDQFGNGDLRPYLLLQILPLVLIPLWQAIYGFNRRDRVWFGIALLLYVLAKISELNDHQIFAALGWISGHTGKHLLATAAAGMLVFRLWQRTSPQAKADYEISDRLVPTEAAQAAPD